MTGTIRPVGPEQAAALAALHATSFAAPWSTESLATLLTQSGVVALVGGTESIEGFILIRTVVDEAEVLTLAVDPAFRGRGLGRRLLEEALKLMRQQGVVRCFLEVATDNRIALALYGRAGFNSKSTRAEYYRRDGGSADAMIMEIILTRNHCHN